MGSGISVLSADITGIFALGTEMPVRKSVPEHHLVVLEAAFFLLVLTGLSSCSLGPLVGKVKEYQVETIVDTLCTNMLSDKEQLRDISSIGLKTVISELPPAATGKTRQQGAPALGRQNG